MLFSLWSDAERVLVSGVRCDVFFFKVIITIIIVIFNFWFLFLVMSVYR